MKWYTSFNQYIKTQPDCSLLTNKESEALKGLLILLVILGHNTYLMADMFAYKFLYAFHVYAFFYLPFLYNHKKERIQSWIVKNLMRLYVPYTFAFVLLLIIYLKTNLNVNCKNVFFAYIMGNPNYFLGIGGFLWFIPTLFSLLFIKQLYYRGNIVFRYIMLCLSAFCLVSFAFGYLRTWQIYQPFRYVTALAMLLPAVLSRFFIEKRKIRLIYLYFFSFVITAFIVYPGEYFYEYTVLNRFIFPVVMFVFLYCQCKLLTDFRYLREIGKYSFPIYIFHIFIYQCCYWVVGNYITASTDTLYLGIIVMIFTIIISYLMARLKIVNLLFPH